MRHASPHRPCRPRPLLGLFLLLLTALAGAGCDGEEPGVFQGYVEGEYVYVSPAMAGRLERLHAVRGQTVQAGAPLFALENAFEQAGVREAEEGLRRAEERLSDLRKGLRPSELESIQAKLRQAAAALKLAEREYIRRRDLRSKGTISQEELDRAKTDYDQKQQRVRELKADLATAGLGARSDEIAGAAAEAQAAEARLDQARWSLEQKSSAAPADAVVFDIYYRPGEWVPAGRPVLSLLPPAGRKVRFYVPETVAGSLALGLPVRVSFDGGGPVAANISFISPRPSTPHP